MQLEDIVIEFLKLVSGELDPHTSQQGKIEDESNGGAVKVALFTPSHIQFAKYGRGPGKQPPIDPLIEWAQGKGIPDPESAAWGMAKAIAKEGTLNWVPNAPNAIDEAVLKYEQEFLLKVSETFGSGISEAITMDKILPPSISPFKI